MVERMYWRDKTVPLKMPYRGGELNFVILIDIARWFRKITSYIVIFQIFKIILLQFGF